MPCSPLLPKSWYRYMHVFPYGLLMISLEAGDVVLLECESVKCIDWPLALVVEVILDKKAPCDC